MTRPLTHDEKLWVFRKATNGFAGSNERWIERAVRGMTDDELAEALAFELGIMGGSCGPDCISIAFQGAGLKIWASWSHPNIVRDTPIFAGKATIAMAREVYGIPDPSDRQITLF